MLFSSSPAPFTPLRDDNPFRDERERTDPPLSPGSEIKFNSFYPVNFTCNIEDKKKSVEKVEKKKKGNKANISTASEAPVKGIISYSTLF